jgi:hypothetical protein
MKYLIEYDADEGFLSQREGEDAAKKGLRWRRLGQGLIAGELGSGESGAG